MVNAVGGNWLRARLGALGPDRGNLLTNKGRPKVPEFGREGQPWPEEFGGVRLATCLRALCGLGHISVLSRPSLEGRDVGHPFKGEADLLCYRFGEEIRVWKSSSS